MTAKSLIIILLFSGSLAFSAGDPDDFLVLPSGTIQIKSFKVNAQDKRIFSEKLELSKQIYEESGGDDKKGMLYGTMASKIEEHAENKLSAIHLVDHDELAAISDYTNESYVTINSGLRGDNDRLIKKELEIRFIISGLNKLHHFEGVVYRALGWGKDLDEVNKNRLDKLFSGIKIDDTSKLDDAFLSSTKDKGTHFLCSPFIYEIHSKTGREITDFSSRPEEKEVLFLPKTKFKFIRKLVKNLDRAKCKQNYGFEQQYWVTIKEI